METTSLPRAVRTPGAPAEVPALPQSSRRTIRGLATHRRPLGSRGNAETIDKITDDGLGGSELARLEERLAHDAMGEDGDRQRLDIVGHDVFAARHECETLG